MVQNTHYGDREGLPFDLKHKAGPIQYRLAPDASRKEIEAERAKLRAVLIEALKPYLGRGATPAANAPFEEVPSTATSAFFWQPGEVLSHLGSTGPAALRHPTEAEDAIDYRFDARRAFYLRLLRASRRAPACVSARSPRSRRKARGQMRGCLRRISLARGLIRILR